MPATPPKPAEDAIDAFIRRLAAIPHPDGCFNPYVDGPDPYAVPGAAAIRRENLAAYLRHQLAQQPPLVLVGEAPGYAGARFSGVAFTSEALILGLEPGLLPPPMALRRTSDPARVQAAVEALGFGGTKKRYVLPCARENSARCVWTLFQAHGRVPLLWNALPFHPYLSPHGLDNRTPRASEFARHRELLDAFLALFPGARVVAVGRKAEATLADLGVSSTCVRHPAQGGHTAFAEQTGALLAALA